MTDLQVRLIQKDYEARTYARRQAQAAYWRRVLVATVCVAVAGAAMVTIWK